MRGFFAAILIGTMMSGAVRQDAIEGPWSHEGLIGTLTRPARPIGGPAVLILAGSGSTDRDGNGPLIKTNAYRLLSWGLATAGIVSLRYDKRGIGSSASLMRREEDMRLEHFVDDAIAAAQNLSGRNGVNSIVIVGHSEGGLIGTLAAERAGASGLVLLAAPGRSLRAVLREQLDTAPMPDEVRTEALRILAGLGADRTVADVPPVLAPMFRLSVQPYLGSMLDVDPAAAMRRLALRALIMHGARDLQIGFSDRNALTAARPDAKVVTLPEANHILKRTTADRDRNIATYSDPELPLDPGVLPPIVEFVLSSKR